MCSKRIRSLTRSLIKQYFVVFSGLTSEGQKTFFGNQIDIFRKKVLQVKPHPTQFDQTDMSLIIKHDHNIYVAIFTLLATSIGTKQPSF